MRIFREGVHRQSLAILRELPFALEMHQGAPGIARFRSGGEQRIGCLGCSHPRCMYFDEREIACDRVEGFPHDQSVNACPAEAMAWDHQRNVPIVNATACIRCGVCVSRCPVGALYFTRRGEVAVNREPSACMEIVQPDAMTSAIHARQIEQLSRVPRTGVSLNASDDIFETIYDKLFRLGSAYHNTVGRNLLIALGCQCAMRRIGDVYARMDAIYASPAGSFGAVEVEFGRDTLEASRGVLDDLAVLHARYGVDKRENKALVICLQLPNARQGYWQVVKDINAVEGVRISTVTIGALMLLLWHGCLFEPEDDRYYIDYDRMDLRHVLSAQMDRDDIPLSAKKLGILEPMK